MARPRTVFGWLMAVTLALAAVMAATGFLLATVYRPPRPPRPTEFSYADIEVVSSGLRWPVASIHRGASWLLLLALLVVCFERLVAVALRRARAAAARPAGRRDRSLAAAAALGATTVALAFTGWQLPWTAMWFWADGSGGINVSGGPRAGSWLVLHTLALPVLWVVLYVVTARAGQARSARDERQRDAVEDVAFAGDH